MNKKKEMRLEEFDDLKNKIFSILHERGYSPEMIDENLIFFTYKKSNFQLIIYQDGCCCFRVVGNNSHFNSIKNKNLLYSIAYEVMRVNLFAKLSIKEDLVFFFRDFICRSIEQFPFKYMKEYLDCMLEIP